MAPRGKKSKNGTEKVWDYWEASGNRGAKILHKQGHLTEFKSGKGIGKKKTVHGIGKKKGHTLEPRHFPFPVEIYRLVAFREIRKFSAKSFNQVC